MLSPAILGMHPGASLPHVTNQSLGGAQATRAAMPQVEQPSCSSTSSLVRTTIPQPSHIVVAAHRGFALLPV
eukprot:4413278-Amphidinium_carterae.1